MNTTLTSWGSPERKVLGSLSTNSQNIPVSPTANLKLLTKVAISELETPVRRKRSVGRSSLSQKDHEAKPRKDKSLGILCDKFLAMFPLNLPPGCKGMEICLDRVAQQLGIVKRRIYDIINILESLQMASKVAKNRYQWHGCQKLASTLCQLKTLALKNGVDKKLQHVLSQQKNGFRLSSGPTCCGLKRSLDVSYACSPSSELSFKNKSVDNVSDLKQESFSEACPTLHSTSTVNEDFFSDERTLGVMCQKFIMLFVASPQSCQLVNLDLATRMLVSEAIDNGDSEKQAWIQEVQCHRQEGEDLCNATSKECRCQLRLKTKVRRLYDIANVLTSLGLIRKVQPLNTSMRKPVFEYVGPCLTSSTFSSENFSLKPNARQSLLNNQHADDTCADENSMVRSNNQKRKETSIKIGPLAKFPRTSSENILNTQRSVLHPRHDEPMKCSRPGSSLDDILQVAEQELEKLRSNEALTSTQTSFCPEHPTVRKKLTFSRSHSDTCLQTESKCANILLSPSNVKPMCNISSNNDGSAAESSSQLKGVLSTDLFSKKSVCVTISDSKSKRFTITRKLVEVPSHVLPKKLPENNVFKVPSITPLQAQTLQTLFGFSPKQSMLPDNTVPNIVSSLNTVVPHLPCSVSGAGVSSPTNEDLLNNNGPKISSTVLPPSAATKLIEGEYMSDGKNKTSFGILTPINMGAVPSIAPGEVYRAIKVGNMVRLVPLLSGKFDGVPLSTTLNN